MRGARSERQEDGEHAPVLPGCIDDVAGWLTLDQAAMLAASAAAAPDGGTIVEIGSFQGRSTIVLAASAPAGATIVAIDPHAGTDRGPGERRGCAAAATADRAAFERNLDRAGVRDRVRHVAAFSADAHAAVPGPIDVLFVDGAHRFAAARADIRQWGAKVAPGGTLLIHDAFSSIGVTVALLRELFAGRRFRYVARSRSLAHYRADLGPGVVARLGNGARQAVQLGWFARNVALKLALTLGAGAILRRVGRAVPEWPY
jgi:predicted O-methyltransferase YrrM